MISHFESDVLIVGGGPAGTSAALSLLNYSNLKVAIVEQSAFDGIKVGEQINPSLFELLEYLKISRSSFSENSFIHGYSSHAAWGSSRIVSRESIFSTQEENYQLDREQFDSLLLIKASKKGATIFPRTRCIDFRQTENNGWEADLMHQSRGRILLQAKYLIDATGRHANVCRKLGIDSVKHDELMAVGTFLHLKDSVVPRQEILIETIKEGWWYCATLPNRKMTVTLFTDAGILKEKQLQKKENWERLLSITSHIKHKLKDELSYEGLWIKSAFSQITNSAVRNNFIAVGDAAASFDPISSMGIGFAISSACHATRAILDYNRGYQFAIADYQQNVYNIFENYLSVKSQFYKKEKRWQDSAFWYKRTGS